MFNEFAHIPWESTPDFSKPHNSKEIPKQNLLVKGSGVSSRVGGKKRKVPLLEDVMMIVNVQDLLQGFLLVEQKQLKFPWRINGAVVQLPTNLPNIKSTNSNVGKYTIVPLIRHGVLHLNINLKIDKI